MADNFVIQLNHVTLGNAKKALSHDLSLQINAGETWGILGANGSGKTTLLHSIAGLQPTLAGDILLHDRRIQDYSIAERAQYLGVLLQRGEADFPATVYDTVMLGRYPQQALWATANAADHAAVQQALAAFELKALAQQCLTTLSGGERQRVALAMLAVQQPSIYLLDEPTNHLDIRHQLQCLDYFTRLDRTVIFSLHDVNLARRHCSHILLLLPTGYIAGAANEVLTVENLEAAYQQAFVRCGGFFHPQ
ncbi:MAG: ABC transporter ATP-binding protein [Gammaproteobacteria bacterium]|nr:ABC transporter ATP-binding protein [Gammaproteobacteria bacterium]